MATDQYGNEINPYDLGHVADVRTGRRKISQRNAPDPSPGPALRQLRKRLGLTLVQVGDRTSLSVSHISEIERGVSSPSIAVMQKLAGVYGTTIHISASGTRVYDDPFSTTSTEDYHA